MVADIVHLSAVRAARQDATPLTGHKLISIYTLLAHTANDHKVHEGIVRQAITTRFGVDEISKIPGNVFEDVVRFLVDLQVEMLTS
jgi:hypothetical protein